MGIIVFGVGFRCGDYILGFWVQVLGPRVEGVALFLMWGLGIGVMDFLSGL